LLGKWTSHIFRGMCHCFSNSISQSDAYGLVFLDVTSKYLVGTYYCSRDTCSFQLENRSSCYQTT